MASLFRRQITLFRYSPPLLCFLIPSLSPLPPVERLRVREDFQVVGLPANDDLGIKAFSFAALLGSREVLMAGDKGKLFHVYLLQIFIWCCCNICNTNQISGSGGAFQITYFCCTYENPSSKLFSYLASTSFGLWVLCCRLCRLLSAAAEDKKLQSGSYANTTHVKTTQQVLCTEVFIRGTANICSVCV